jgi:hypothetical protein
VKLVLLGEAAVGKVDGFDSSPLASWSFPTTLVTCTDCCFSPRWSFDSSTTTSRRTRSPRLEVGSIRHIRGNLQPCCILATVPQVALD